MKAEMFFYDGVGYILYIDRDRVYIDLGTEDKSKAIKVAMKCLNKCGSFEGELLDDDFPGTEVFIEGYPVHVSTELGKGEEEVREQWMGC